MARTALTDNTWEQLQSTMKAHSCHTWKNDRQVMEAILCHYSYQMAQTLHTQIDTRIKEN